MHFTHFYAYEDFTRDTGIDIVSNPTLLENNGAIALETATWFWKNKQNGQILKESAKDTPEFQSDLVTKKITKLVNGGSMKLSERQLAKKKYRRKIYHTVWSL